MTHNGHMAYKNVLWLSPERGPNP